MAYAQCKRSSAVHEYDNAPVYSVANNTRDTGTLHDGFDPRALFTRQATDWKTGHQYSYATARESDSVPGFDHQYSTIDGDSEVEDEDEMPPVTRRTSRLARHSRSSLSSLPSRSPSRHSADVHTSQAAASNVAHTAQAAASNVAPEVTEAYIAATERGRNRDSFVRVSDRWGLPLPDMIIMMADFERQQSEEL